MVIAKYRCSAGGRFDQEVVELGSAVNGSAAPRSPAVNGSAGGRYSRSAVGQLVPARSAGPAASMSSKRLKSPKEGGVAYVYGQLRLSARRRWNDLQLHIGASQSRCEQALVSRICR